MTYRNFHKILIANRGEIALRIIRAVRELDKLAVVVHSEFDRDLPFVTEADEAYSLGSGDLSDTYLNVEKILEVARVAQADAVHPGYGFLAENAAFASACRSQGIPFIGPEPETISLMGNKANARKKAVALGIPVLDGVVDSLESLILQQEEMTYPLLIKPAAGGGGKGMRIVHASGSFATEAREASREAMNYFGSEELYVERYLENPRHIEVQVLGDFHGKVIHLYERECSLQRRYQKIIEEAPSLFVTEQTRAKITDAAIQLAQDIGYTGAGTVEFLMAENQDFYFLEMNTRIQVEHPVTEMITGIDLVKEQITVAEGRPLSIGQKELRIRGHAIEARVYAENPENDFLPSSGRIETYELPIHKDTRIDNGFREGNLVEPYYDPLLAKAVALGRTRNEALNRLIGLLKDIRITGLTTNRDFLVGLLRSETFRENRLDTGYVDRELPTLMEKNRQRKNQMNRDHLLASATLIALQTQQLETGGSLFPWHSIGHWRILPEITLQTEHEEIRIRYELVKGRQRIKLHVGEKDYLVALERRERNKYWISINHQILKVWGIADRSEILLDQDGHLFRLRRMDILDRRFIRSGGGTQKEDTHQVVAPLNGRIVQINVKEGDGVEEGDSLLVIESMKMENKILASRSCTIDMVKVSVGAQVQSNQVLLTLA